MGAGLLSAKSKVAQLQLVSLRPCCSMQRRNQKVPCSEEDWCNVSLCKHGGPFPFPRMNDGQTSYVHSTCPLTVRQNLPQQDCQVSMHIAMSKIVGKLRYISIYNLQKHPCQIQDMSLSHRFNTVQSEVSLSFGHRRQELLSAASFMLSFHFQLQVHYLHLVIFHHLLCFSGSSFQTNTSDTNLHNYLNVCFLQMLLQLLELLFSHCCPNKQLWPARTSSLSPKMRKAFVNRKKLPEPILTVKLACPMIPAPPILHQPPKGNALKL